MPKKIELSPEKAHIELVGGEIFDGDPLQATTELAKSQEATKQWGSEWKQKAETSEAETEQLRQEIERLKAAAVPLPQSEIDTGNWIWDAAAKVVPGAKNGKDLMMKVTNPAPVKDPIIEQMKLDRAILDFKAKCPDFPDNNEAADALVARARNDFQIQGDFDDFCKGNPPLAATYMVAAHRACVADGVYKPLNPEEQRRAVGDQAAIEQQRRPTAPPIVRSSSPDSENRGLDLWKEPMAEQRARLIREQLDGGR